MDLQGAILERRTYLVEPHSIQARDDENLNVDSETEVGDKRRDLRNI